MKKYIKLITYVGIILLFFLCYVGINTIYSYIHRTSCTDKNIYLNKSILNSNQISYLESKYKLIYSGGVSDGFITGFPLRSIESIYTDLKNDINFSGVTLVPPCLKGPA